MVKKTLAYKNKLNALELDCNGSCTARKKSFQDLRMLLFRKYDEPIDDACGQTTEKIVKVNHIVY